MKKIILSSALAVLAISAKTYQFDTDEWLNSAKFVIGSQNRTAHLQLDFHNEITMVTGFNCKECRVQVYDPTESQSYKPSSNSDMKSLIYKRSKLTPPEVFNGTFGSDYLCFNGDVNDQSCTYSVGKGPEFFVINDLPDDLTNNLYSGMVGLSVDPFSQYVSLVSYLKNSNLIDVPMVSIALSKQQGQVTIGGYKKELIKGGKTEPKWVPLHYKKFSGGWLGGWAFNSTNISVGMYQMNTHDPGNATKPIYVMLTSENDHGYTLVSGHHRAGEYFIGNITSLYNKTGQDQNIGAHCDRTNSTDTLDGHRYTCKFLKQQCSQVLSILGGEFLITVGNDKQERLLLNLNDALYQNGSTCHMDVSVEYDPSVNHDYLVVGTATFARSQYVVYDYTNGTERIGFGGNYSPYPHDDPDNPDKKHPHGMSGWIWFLLILAIIGVVVGAFFFIKKRQQKINSHLQSMEERLDEKI